MSNLVFILRNNSLFPVLTPKHVTEWPMGENVQPLDSNIELTLRGKWHLLETLQHNIIVILLCSI